MEPFAGIMKRRKVTVLRRPFPVRPFLSVYSTSELSGFMRTHLNPPFNGRFAKFIEVLKMTGADYVKLTQKDLERICDNEGPYLHDLILFQTSLRPPFTTSPHVREIFSLPEVPNDPVHNKGEEPIDIFGPDANLVFDFPDEQVTHSVFECLIPLPPTPTPPLSIELPSEAPSEPVSPAWTTDGTIHTDDDGDDSLIDMFSPVSPSIGLASNDEWSESDVPSDIFDSPHLGSICSPPLSPCGDGEDILGLGSLYDQESVFPEETPVVTGLQLEGAGGEAEGEEQEAIQPGVGPGDQNDIDDSALQSPALTNHYEPSYDEQEASAAAPTPQLPGAHFDVETEGSAYSDRSPSPSIQSLEEAEAEALDELDEGGDNNDDTSPQPVEIEDGVEGLSCFMSGLRSLDSRAPSPAFDPSSYSPLSFTHPDCVLNGGLLGLAVSPEFSLIETPVIHTTNDDVLIASPSSAYHHHHRHEYRPPFEDPEQIVAKPLGLDMIPSCTPDGSGHPREVDQPPALNPAPVARARPTLEVAIPALPSFFDDEHLSSLMSSIELAKVRPSTSAWSLSRTNSSSSRSYLPSGSVLSVSRAPSSSEAFGGWGKERVVWPVSTTAERWLPSPHQKHGLGVDVRSQSLEESMGGEGMPEEQVAEGKPLPEREGTPASLPKEEQIVVSVPTVKVDPPVSSAPVTIVRPTDVGKSHRADVPPPPPEKQSPTASTSLSSWKVSVGGFFRTILTPIDASSDDRVA